MANSTHTIVIMITVSALAAVWYLNQKRAEDSASGGPLRGRLRSGLVAVKSLVQEVRLGGVISPTSAN